MLPALIRNAPVVSCASAETNCAEPVESDSNDFNCTEPDTLSTLFPLVTFNVLPTTAISPAIVSAGPPAMRIAPLLKAVPVAILNFDPLKLMPPDDTEPFDVKTDVTPELSCPTPEDARIEPPNRPPFPPCKMRFAPMDSPIVSPADINTLPVDCEVLAPDAITMEPEAGTFIPSLLLVVSKIFPLDF